MMLGAATMLAASVMSGSTVRVNAEGNGLLPQFLPNCRCVATPYFRDPDRKLNAPRLANKARKNRRGYR